MASSIIKPPSIITPEIIKKRASIALFGSIEQGTATEWQKEAEKFLAPFDIDIYNPRRDAWNSTWKQTIDNPEFVAQVEWELTVLENVDVKLFYFDPTTKAPITLLELGLSSRSGSIDMVVCCPEGYWRKGNIDIICRRYGIHQEPTLDDALHEVRGRLNYYYNVPKTPPVVAPIVEPPAVVPLEEL